MTSHSGSPNVWVFSEERSGSSWLSSELAQRLGKQHCGVDQFEENSQWVHHTHEFEFLELISNPIVIHTTRRDQVEHFLSWIFFIHRKQAGWNHPHVSFPGSECRFQEMLKLPPIVVTQIEVEEWLQLKTKRGKLLSKYSGEYQTIYYEDLFDGVYIPSLHFQIGFKDGGHFRKLPYEKNNVIANVDEVRKWCEE